MDNLCATTYAHLAMMKAGVRFSATKVRVVATVDRSLCLEMERIHVQEIERAKAEDRTEPNWSNTVEMLLRKGTRGYRNKPHGQS